MSMSSADALSWPCRVRCFSSLVFSSLLFASEQIQYLLYYTREGVDGRSKGPLLDLDNSGGVWPQQYREEAGVSMELETPLLTPSAPPLDAALELDDCCLDDTISAQVMHLCIGI